jgi:hypothetical protein
MQKVLIISYYFPPCNLTAAQRIGSWEKYLPENGFYPIVVTRNWTGEELNEVQRLKKSGTDIRHIQKDNSEIFYMPYRATFRDRCFEKGQANRFYRNLSKVLTAVNLIGQNFSIRFIPFNNLFFQARKILKKNPEIKHLIISGNPFEQFYFGYLLKKEFPSLKMIADYRDDWTTSELFKTDTLLKKILTSFNIVSEKKWGSSFDLITSVSEVYKDRISNFIGVKGSVLLNGFEFSNVDIKPIYPSEKEFTINFTGSLYDSQPIEDFLITLKDVITENNQNIKILILFPGLNDNQSQSERIIKNMIGFESNYKITNRLPRQEVIEWQLKSDLMLMLSHKNIKGIPSSKLYEYIGLKKPVLLYPNDEDIIAKTLIDTNLGIIVNTNEEIKRNLNKMILQKVNNTKIEISHFNTDSYSRQYQAKKLSNLLYELNESN